MPDTASLNTAWIRLLDALPAPALVTGQQGLIHHVNPAFSTLAGTPSASLINRNLPEFLSGSSLHHVNDDEQRTLSGEIVNSETTFHIPGTGREFTLLISRLLAEHPQWGDVIVQIGHDTAAARSSEQNDTIAHVSHELQTPLSYIAGLTELLLDSSLDPDQRESVRLIQSTAEACRALLSDMLDVSRPGLGKWSVRPTEFSLREFLDEILKPFAIRALSSRLEFSYSIAQELPERIYHDPLRLRQILQNLVGNAVKYTESGLVHVNVSQNLVSDNQAGVQFDVRDTGIGIPKEKQAEIFEPFVQAHGCRTRRYGGTGLGLSIASRIVSLLGGRIWVESEPRRGSVFSFIVPYSVGRDGYEVDSGRGRGGFDRNCAMAVAGDDANLVKELAGLFLQEYPRLLADLRAAVKERDPKKLDTSAHALKGAVANFGARAAVEAALRIEAKGRAGDTEGIDEALALLEHIFEPLLLELKSVLVTDAVDLQAHKLID